MINAKMRKRSQAISIEGRLDDRYFAVTSEVPRKIVEARISAMPRNGRSARAGASAFVVSADVSADFLGGDNSDDVTGAWSSLAAAAGGGVTGAARGKWNNRIVEAAENDTGAASARTENR